MRNAAGAEMAVTLKQTIVFDDPEAMCRAALLGLGVTLIAIPQWYADAGPISIYYASRTLLPAKTRVFVDHVIEGFRGERWQSDSQEALAGSSLLSMQPVGTLATFPTSRQTGDSTRALQLVSRHLRTRPPFGPATSAETNFDGRRRRSNKRIVADPRRSRRLRAAAKSALNAAFSACHTESLRDCRLRGGPGRTRTCNQTVMSGRL
jgi:hypothetical protein